MKTKGPVTKLREDLVMREIEAKDLKDKYLRALAELDNFRKRMAKEYEDYKVYAKIDFFVKVIPVLDSFDRAMSGAELNNDFENFFKGVEIICRQLKDALNALGLVEFSGLGETFDPNRHEAVAVIETDDKPENTVVEEVSRGYMVGDRVIKPAKVFVSKQKEGGQEDGKDNRD